MTIMKDDNSYLLRGNHFVLYYDVVFSVIIKEIKGIIV